jgi:nitrogen fixation NifU-like protein
MSDLRELYQEVILDHNRRPRNFRRLEAPSCSLDGHTPLCGDRISLDVQIEDGVIRDIGFAGSGCAISKASASLMTESVKGRRAEEADALFAAVHQMLLRGPGGDFDPDEVGDLEVLAGVAEYPTRIKCAMLSWHTLHGALHGEHDPVSTETGDESGGS